MKKENKSSKTNKKYSINDFAKDKKWYIIIIVVLALLIALLYNHKVRFYVDYKVDNVYLEKNYESNSTYLNFYLYSDNEHISEQEKLPEFISNISFKCHNKKTSKYEYLNLPGRYAVLGHFLVGHSDPADDKDTNNMIILDNIIEEEASNLDRCELVGIYVSDEIKLIDYIKK